jgi:predicted DNA-binding transcriptional regulator YafY
MRADRLLSIMLLLQTRGKMTAEALSIELEVSRRTILRDLDALSMAGVPVVAEGGHGGGITLDENYRNTLAGMQADEVRTLFLTHNQTLMNEIGLGQASRSSLLKLLAVLPATHQPSVAHIRQRILIDPAWWWRDSEPPPFWDELQRAVYEDYRVRVVYEKHDGQVTERTLEPYSLVAKSSLWYLVARQGKEFRTFRVARLQQLKVLGVHFERQTDFDLPTYWQEHLQYFGDSISEYHFTLSIDPDRLSFVRQLLPGRWEVQNEPAGRGWLTIRFHLDSMELAKMLVLGLGRQAVVVEPQTLKQAVLSTAQEIIQSLNKAASHPCHTSP